MGEELVEVLVNYSEQSLSFDKNEKDQSQFLEVYFIFHKNID